MDDIQQPASTQSTITGAAFIVPAALWLASLEMAIRYHRVGLIAAGVVGLALIVWAVWQWWVKISNSVVAVATTMLVLTTLGGLSFVAGIWAQQVVIVVGVLTLWLVGQQRQRQHDDLRGRTMAFATAVFIWLTWFSFLSASVYLNIRMIWLLGGAALMTAAAAHLVWLESGIDPKKYRWGLFAVAWFGGELFAVTWWLPTTIFVGSAVATTVVALMIQACRHLWVGNWEPGRSRRYLTIGTGVILFVLLSARWI